MGLPVACLLRELASPRSHPVSPFPAARYQPPSEGAPYRLLIRNWEACRETRLINIQCLRPCMAAVTRPPSEPHLKTWTLTGASAPALPRPLHAELICSSPNAE
ncbi:hypothetical protein AAFF_G00387530 [Aldrovandia affinis]|uniref:Uncharacterized protein n=1 Tax=Aldrovandia affinis TaxID=143900 RepID=A0AAD7WL96_9TELE|nr:hypothetical protein AAFF_G00387530 [Aldrovandia affinis]